MKKALVVPVQPVGEGYRIAEVSDVVFEVAESLFWIDCDDSVVADQYYYDPLDTNIKELPVFDAKEINPIGGVPNVIA